MTADQGPFGPKPHIILKYPRDCSDEELRRFHDIVVSAGEVRRYGLRDRIDGAEVLAFLETEGKTIGAGALKRQHRDYAAKQFRKARARSDARDFQLELGWIVIDEAHRGRGYSRHIVDRLLKHSNGHRVYATSASTNKPMHRTLLNYGFEQDGMSWPSNEREGTDLLLFVSHGVR